jgi:alginate O-acetyltransferase complex protein AlgI
MRRREFLGVAGAAAAMCPRFSGNRRTTGGGSMVFSSLTFVCVFLPAVLACYFFFPRSFRNGVLVAASLVFYLWGGKIAVVLVILSIATNFVLGQAIAQAKDAKRYRLIAWSVAGNLLVLIVFKYTNFLVDNINSLLDAVGSWRLPAVNVALPLGISFFTFHIISYLVDIYRGIAQAQRSPVAFALYIINFPQLIAGPIIRYRPFAPQLENRTVSFSDVDAGVARFAAGLAKKLLIANPIGAITDRFFEITPSELPIWAVWFAAICFGLQIYFDFSGYTDMAIGMARMFGFRFPENFNYPYASTSMQDFWRRWHMSLTAWFRDYVYIPLGGNRDGAWATTRNLWSVFLLCGLWHGASWTFVAWGMWHGLFLSFERLAIVRQALSTLPAVLKNAYVLLVVGVGWIFFRSPTLDGALGMISRMFGLRAAAHTTLPEFSLVGEPAVALVILAACFALPVWPYVRDRTAALVARSGALVTYDVTRAIVVGVMTLLCLATMAIDQNHPFIYFQF